MFRSHQSSAILLFLLIALAIIFLPVQLVVAVNTQGNSTPLQLEIEKLQNRLSSTDSEERRDAITRLGNLRHPEASRAALAGLKDVAAIVRVTAAGAILFLPAEESAAALIPLLNDKQEFVRQETAYALGKTRSRTAVAPMIELLAREKKHSVRGAIMVALGEIGDQTAVVTLAQVLRPNVAVANSKRQSSKKENVLVLRAAATALGQIGNRAAVPALLATLQDEQAETDVRREAAIALGLIGDAAALPALNALSSDVDPYLSLAAHQAAHKISHRQ